MRLVVQRVLGASVEIRKELISEIGKGLLVYLGVGNNDVLTDVDYLVNKVLCLRIFEDNTGKMNLNLEEVGGSILLLVGLFVRWVTLPLLLILGTAVFTIHWDNGWSHENNGVELAATYSLLLLVLLLSGGGKYLSLDYWVSVKK